MKNKPLVLLVEDDANSRIAVRELLGDEHEVLVASDGPSALRLLDRHTPHVIVSDVEMPGMSGLELTRLLKGQRRFREIPIILITGHTRRSAIGECFAAGADDYLPKPVDSAEFHARIGAAVRSSQLRRELQRVQQSLLQASRRAGQAEVAIGVLHDVGNALNGINTCVKLIQPAVAAAEDCGIGRVRELLASHAAGLKDALGDKADLLLAYCDAAAQRHAERIVGVRSETRRLVQHVEHVSIIVSSQQRFAAAAALRVEVDPVNLVDNAEALVGWERLSRCGYHRELEAIGFVADEHPVLQILVNLLKNAADAVTDCTDPEVVLRCWRGGDEQGEHVTFVVEDNGVGIAQAELGRIFEYGHTTKVEGHGFGLHGSANAAAALNGTLRAFSAGPGQGARFTLRLPADAGSQTPRGMELRETAA